MRVNECLRRINFKVGTLDDISGRAVNQIVNNQTIVDELNSQLRQYANITKGIQDIFSFPLNTNTPFVEAPSLALRSGAYYYIYVISQGTIFPCDMRGASEVYPVFTNNPNTGITNWIMPWGAGANGQFLSFFPMNNVSAATNALNGNITDSDTTITVNSTASFISNHGRITIDDEKIMFTYKDTTKFYGCERGIEMTTAALHTDTTAVTENNVVLFYSRLHVPIIVQDDNIIERTILNREIEVVEEHMEGIIKAVAYNLIIKMDPTRAGVYKLDSDDMYKQYAMDIKKGYYRGNQGSGIRAPYFNESGTPYATNLRF